VVKPRKTATGKQGTVARFIFPSSQKKPPINKMGGDKNKTHGIGLLCSKSGLFSDTPAAWAARYVVTPLRNASCEKYQKYFVNSYNK
jgi:hypothetical protein